MALPYGTHGCHFGDKVDDLPFGSFIDMRLSEENKYARLCVRDPEGYRDLAKATQKGVKYSNRVCTKCDRCLPIARFENHSITESYRKRNGFNTICRDCQRRKYSYGYRADVGVDGDSGFVVDSDEEETDD